MRNTLILIIFSINLIGCSKEAKDDNRYNIYLTDDGDTLSYVNYRLYPNYSLFNKGQIDSVITSKSSQELIDGTFLLGITHKHSNKNRYLTFRSPDGYTFDNYINNPERSFIKDDFKFTDYRVELLNNYQDSSSAPTSMHQLLVAIDNLSNDTLVYQEYAFGRKPEHLAFSVLLYEDEQRKNEMHEIILDIIAKVDK